MSLHSARSCASLAVQELVDEDEVGVGVGLSNINLAIRFDKPLIDSIANDKSASKVRYVDP